MKGIFRPKNPSKYKGDPTNIVYRSSYELKLFRFLDEHQDVEWWQSEEVWIPYRSPLDNRIHRYFPDVVVKTPNGTTMIEVKPAKQTVPPKKQTTKRGQPSKQYIREVMEWGKNDAKWKAARDYCEDRGWTFAIYTEKELGLPYK